VGQGNECAIDRTPERPARDSTVATCNLVVRRRNAVGNAFVGIDSQRMMRYDLIPNLVAVVRPIAGPLP